MFKNILSSLAIIGTIVISAYAIDPTIYKGNKNVWGAIYVTSATISGYTAASGSATNPVISAATYINKADVVLKNDPNGSDVFLSSAAVMNTTTGSNCFKLYPGESISSGGKNLDAIYARTLAGSSNGTTIWYIISYQDR